MKILERPGAQTLENLTRTVTSDHFCLPSFDRQTRLTAIPRPFIVELMTIFTKIINKEIPAQVVYEDDQCLAFRDVNPQAPVHVILIPKREIPTMNDVIEADSALLGHLMAKAPQIAKQLGIADTGFRLVVNTNAHAGQSVSHIHIHILGGRALGWPPG